MRFQNLISFASMFRFLTENIVVKKMFDYLPVNKLCTFINPEDILDKRIKVKYDNPDVERCRRAHRNDMENILPFFVIGFLYLLINPDAKLAINLFRACAISRIVHTFVYAVVVIPQPSRILAFLVCALATTYMAFQVALTTL